ncbi:MAG: exonuclease domain-containing protein, partial [Onishia taeanensis]
MADEQGAPRNDRLIWIDLEMTGLDPNRERIIEIATLITDSELNLIA